MRRISALSLMLLWPALAMAQPSGQQDVLAFPDWSGREHCERQMRMIANESAFLLNACIDQEERSMRQLRGTWPNTPAGPLRHCVRTMETARMRSYMMLNACVEQERNAIQDLERRRR